MGVVIPFKPREKNIPTYDIDEDDYEEKYEAILCLEIVIEKLEKKIEERKKTLNRLDTEAMQEIDNLQKQIAFLTKSKMDAMRDLLGGD